MAKLPHKWLFDIVTYSERVQAYLAEVPAFSAYEADEKTQLAIERRLEIIG